jgi:hypothetical protein
MKIPKKRLCIWDDDEKLRGMPTKEYEHLYEVWGKGGFGVIIRAWCDRSGRDFLFLEL